MTRSRSLGGGRAVEDHSEIRRSLWCSRPATYRLREDPPLTSRPSISVVVADITTLDVDAIVNAANSSLLGGSGVDGAIHRAAGQGLLEECRLLGGCETGDAKTTGGHDLPAQWVIHTVGAVWYGGERGEADLLASCYRSCLREADKLGASSIAFPAISTGLFGYPKAEAARIALGTIKATPTNVAEVVLCAFSDEDARYYRDLIDA